MKSLLTTTSVTTKPNIPKFNYEDQIILLVCIDLFCEGVWYVHCHYEMHQSTGMNTVIIVKNGTTAEQTMLPPTDDMPACSSSSGPTERGGFFRPSASI